MVQLISIPNALTYLPPISILDNSLNCSCDSQELWQWLRDHPKWTRPEDGTPPPPTTLTSSPSSSSSGAAAAAGGAATTASVHQAAAWLRCEQPAALRSRIFIELEPPQFCDMPLILKLAIQDIQPYSVLVSWQGRDHTGLSGYRVLYQALDNGGSGEPFGDEVSAMFMVSVDSIDWPQCGWWKCE